MKFFHLGDLHLGKNLHAQNLLEDQKYVLQQVLTAAKNERPDAVLLAGDIYNNSQPSGETMSLLNWFLSSLVADLGIPVYAISGNHDGAEHLSFGADLMKSAGYYISKPFRGEVLHYSRLDEKGRVNFYLLPYLTKSQVKRAYPEEPVPETLEQALRLVFNHLKINKDERNILLAHLFVTGAEKGDSETMAWGGVDGVSPEIFEDFDYVALGHIHRSQNVADKVRYCGAMLPYSFGEADNKPSITVIDMDGEGAFKKRLIDLLPLHPLRIWQGTFREICALPETLDYLKITLTDKQEIVDAFYKLKSKFPNLLWFNYLGKELCPVQSVRGTFEEVMAKPGSSDSLEIILTDTTEIVDVLRKLQSKFPNLVQYTHLGETIVVNPNEADVSAPKTPLEHFREFYALQNGMEPSAKQLALMQKWVEDEK